MIVCGNCDYQSLDMDAFNIEYIHGPRGVKYDPQLSELDIKFYKLKARFLKFTCPKCGEIYTTKPDELTTILLTKRR